MPSIEVKNLPFDVALRRFKKKVENADILREYREREFFEKPSETKKKKKAAARKRAYRERMSGVNRKRLY